MSLTIQYLLCLFLAVINLCLANSHSHKERLFLGKYPYPKKTTGPINIDTLTAHRLTLPPLILVGKKYGLTKLQNTGITVLATPFQALPLATLTGGPLGNDIYEFYQFRYYWTDNLNGTATDTIDNKYSIFISACYFKNRKYPSAIEALNRRDGIAEIAIPFTICSTPNLQFDKLGENIKKVWKPGFLTFPSFGTLMEAVNFLVPNNKYYTYPAAIPSQFTQEIIYYSDTAIVMVPNERMCFTVEQFESTFGSLKNATGQPMVNEADQLSVVQPIVEAEGIIQTWQ